MSVVQQTPYLDARIVIHYDMSKRLFGFTLILGWKETKTHTLFDEAIDDEPATHRSCLPRSNGQLDYLFWCLVVL